MAGSASSMGDLPSIPPDPIGSSDFTPPDPIGISHCADSNPKINETGLSHKEKKSSKSLSVPLKTKRQLIDAKLIKKKLEKSNLIPKLTTSKVSKDNSTIPPIFESNFQSEISLPNPTVTIREPVCVKYTAQDSGPYFIYVETIDKNIGRLHPISVGKIIFDITENINISIVSMSPIGKNRFKLTTNSWTGANQLIKAEKKIPTI